MYFKTGFLYFNRSSAFENVINSLDMIFKTSFAFALKNIINSLEMIFKTYNRIEK